MGFGGRTGSLFNQRDIPANVTWDDPSPVELGVAFQSSVAGFITGLRFYKGPQNTGTHVGNLWTATGTKFASLTFTNETASDWQTATFANPVAIQANTTYVASYFAPSGHWARTNKYFTTDYTNGPLTALADSTSGGNGVWVFNANPSTF